jgi:hypothetical protein
LLAIPDTRKIRPPANFMKTYLGRLPFGTCVCAGKSSLGNSSVPTGISNGDDVAYFSKIFFSATVYYTKSDCLLRSGTKTA